MHSGLSDGEKFDEWRKVRWSGPGCGRSAVPLCFAPLDNIGAIIIDEEHEATYKQESILATMLERCGAFGAGSHGAVLVLGSATPSIETRARAQKGVTIFLRVDSEGKS